ncbi:MAG: SDR family NAD(P)-dependent oxidoreductase [Chloroflexi bacterium]|nr:SDR family NAD(P)-dependent oxidoreductase [Chloroflexota bacterium]
MRITVTGGTGFVGSHTVAALVAAGHEVRLFARSRDRVAPALAPLGVAQELETIEGDVTDAAAVERALTGTEAVVHVASVYSLDRRDAARMRAVNVAGTRTVIETAHRLGAARIVHVSSVLALLDAPGSTVSPQSEAAHAGGAYGRSKQESERVARELRDGGAPVVISYPGMVWGPQDPYVGETCQFIRNMLRGLLTMMPRGTLITSDVRDVAALHAALVMSERPAPGYLAPSHTLAITEVFAAVAAATGRRIPVLTLPAAAVMPLPWLASTLQPVLPVRVPWPYEGAWFVAQNHTADDSATRRDFGLEPRHFAQSAADTVRWMAEAGHISARQAGRLAS